MIGKFSYTPVEVAELVEASGIVKAKAPIASTVALGVLAGAFVAIGGVFATIVGTDSAFGFGPTRLLMGVGFSLGIILVIVAGSELFTGNNLVVISWISRRISLIQLLRNWGIVYIGNLAGALIIVSLVYYARWWEQADVGVGAIALDIANTKVGLSPDVVFVRGILANVLVCLAVWLAMGGRSVIDKSVGIVFPVAAFVASGFEHSVANMYFIPIGLLLANEELAVAAAGLSTDEVARLTISGFLSNMLWATMGNVVGGGIGVGLVYWFIYLRGSKRSQRV